MSKQPATPTVATEQVTSYLVIQRTWDGGRYKMSVSCTSPTVPQLEPDERVVKVVLDLPTTYFDNAFPTVRAQIPNAGDLDSDYEDVFSAIGSKIGSKLGVTP